MADCTNEICIQDKTTVKIEKGQTIDIEIKNETWVECTGSTTLQNSDILDNKWIGNERSWTYRWENLEYQETKKNIKTSGGQ